MQAVVAAAMNCTQVFRMISATLATLNQMVCRVGAGQPADVTDAAVAGDDSRRQLAPSLRPIGAVDLIGTDALRRLPARRPVQRRLPRHECLVVAVDQFGASGHHAD